MTNLEKEISSTIITYKIKGDSLKLSWTGSFFWHSNDVLSIVGKSKSV